MGADRGIFPRLSAAREVAVHISWGGGVPWSLWGKRIKKLIKQVALASSFLLELGSENFLCAGPAGECFQHGRPGGPCDNHRTVTLAIAACKQMCLPVSNETLFTNTGHGPDLSIPDRGQRNGRKWSQW